MKNNFKKLLATLMSAATVTTLINTNTAPIFAVKPQSLECSKDERHRISRSKNIPKIISYCEKQIRRFRELPQELLPGTRAIFEIDPSVPKTLEPKLIGIYLSKINELFETYPNIAREFIRIVECSPNQAFTFTAFPGIGSLKNADASFSHYPVLRINIMPYMDSSYEDHLDRMLKELPHIDKGLECGSDCRLVEWVIAHEMGHLFSFTLAHTHLYKKDPHPLRNLRFLARDMDIGCRDMYDALAYMNDFVVKLESREDRREMQEIIDKAYKSCFLIRKKLSETFEDLDTEERDMRLDAVCDTIHQDVVRKLHKKEGYVDTYLTDYGAKDSCEWVAESFAYATCSKYCKKVGLEPLWNAVLEWLDEADYRLS